MQKKKRSQWRKLDNAAQAFPAATGKKDTRVFRLYCELKEDVIEEVLQKAVECTLEKYPLYCSVLRKVRSRPSLRSQSESPDRLQSISSPL